MNFVYALPNATTFEDICALNGRIFKTKEKPIQCGTIRFGSSKHVSSIVLAAMSADISMRSALNIKYSQKNLDLCKKAGLKIGSFDRKDEPKKTSSTMEWGTKQAIKEFDFVPDAIYDEGGIGKEPMIRLIGKNPKNVLEKFQKLL